MKYIKWFLMCNGFFALIGCGDESREELELQLDVENTTEEFTFEGNVRPIITEFCVTCHPNTDPIPLVSFEQVRRQATIVSNAINGRPGSVLMPLGRTMPQINIDIIDAWIAGGLIEK